MNGFVCIHDKDEIEGFARENVDMHIYTIGDLDDFFWPHTQWYGIKAHRRLRALACLYVAQSLPTLLLFSDENSVGAELLGAVRPLLPQAFHAHLSPGLDLSLRDTFALDCHGSFLKMALVRRDAIAGVRQAGVRQLGQGDLKELLTFYAESYPNNWFDPRMLETGHYYGLRRDSRLVSVAGVHVFSPRYRVAALGNITTHPACRGRGYAVQVTAHLCRSLEQHVDHIGLNVMADNQAAISCYGRLGFQTIGQYEEFNAERK